MKASMTQTVLLDARLVSGSRTYLENLLNPTCKAGQLGEELFQARALHHEDPLGVKPPPSPHCVAGDPRG